MGVNEIRETGNFESPARPGEEERALRIIDDSNGLVRGPTQPHTLPHRHSQAAEG
jgi:hypothetical protein